MLFEWCFPTWHYPICRNMSHCVLLHRLLKSLWFSVIPCKDFSLSMLIFFFDFFFHLYLAYLFNSLNDQCSLHSCHILIMLLDAREEIRLVSNRVSLVVNVGLYFIFIFLGWHLWKSWTAALMRLKVCPLPLASVSASALLPQITTSLPSFPQRWVFPSMLIHVIVDTYCPVALELLLFPLHRWETGRMQRSCSCIQTN